jgi:hypothetical protein
MTPEYYILSGPTPAGPYDLVALIRKIRNGTLTQTMLIQLSETADAKPAGEWAQLSEFFDEIKDEPAHHGQHHLLKDHNIVGTLQNGLRFLQRNQVTTIFSGILVFAIILMTIGVFFLLPPSLHMAGFVVSFVVTYFFITCYQLSVLRMARGQPVDAAYLRSRIMPAFKSLALASLLISLVAIIGLVMLVSSANLVSSIAGLLLFALPGLFMLTIYAFVPLLILDQGYGLWEAMELSRKKVFECGPENAGIIFGLFVINFIGGLLALLPLTVTLPITMGPLAEIYDEIFS